MVGFSGFLTPDLRFDEVEALEEAGVRDSLKIRIDGGRMNDEDCKYVHANNYSKDRITHIDLCRQ